MTGVGRYSRGSDESLNVKFDTDAVSHAGDTSVSLSRTPRLVAAAPWERQPSCEAVDALMALGQQRANSEDDNRNNLGE